VTNPKTQPYVLVVDDDTAVRCYLRAVLEIDSYMVETASSGDEALDWAGREPSPDVVLLDLQMPGMNGIQTLQQLRKLQPKPKVIVCSGIEHPGTMLTAFLLGAEEYLTKPFLRAQLSAALVRCLGQPN